MSQIIRTITACTTFILLVSVSGAPIASAQTSKRKKPPTFSNEIIRIFQNRCQSCHHPGAPFAPMSLYDYKDVRPWVKAIQKKVVQKAMPPWHADSSVGNFTNDISITQQEIDTISQWVDARAPQGNRADLPPVKTFENGWQIGEPDLVLDTGIDLDVPAKGTLPAQYFQLDTEFDEDRWLSAIEARPSNREIVRQIDIYIKNPEDGVAIPDGGALGNGLLGVYARGDTSSVYREGEGKLIKPGAKIILKILYVPNGIATTDRSQVALKFHKKPVQKHVITRGIAETKFEIPPHVPDFDIYATHEFKQDVTLLSMRPLMHYRGKQFLYIAHYPDGRDVALLYVNRYNFDWQTAYFPKEPIRLPAGTVLECRGLMNNSHENIKNPEPHGTIHYGDQPFEEKMIGWIDYTLDN